MKCTKHKGCEAFWDGNGRLTHTKGRKVSEVQSTAPKRQKARKRAAGGRSRGAASTTEAVTRTTTPATQTTDVTPDTT